MEIDEKKLLSDLRRIGTLLAVARDAVGIKQPEAGELVGVSERTVGNWEGAAGDGGPLRPLLLLHHLCQRDPLARDMALQILGLKEHEERDKRMAARMLPVRRALESEDELVKAQLRALELALKKSGESVAADA